MQVIKVRHVVRESVLEDLYVNLVINLKIRLFPSYRSQCHLSQPVTHGLLRDGGPGLPQDPAPPLH